MDDNRDRVRTGFGRREFIRVSALGLSALAASSPRRAFGASAAIRIGMQMDMTGDLGDFGSQWISRSAQAAAEKINQGGGIGGREVQLLIEDTESKPPTGVRKMRKLIESDGVDFVIGSHHSGVNLVSNPVAEELKTVYFPNGTATATTGAKGNPYVFRVLPSITHEISSAVSWPMSNLGKRWTLMGLDYAWGQDHVTRWSKTVETLGGKVVDRIMVPLGSDNMVPYLSRVKAEETEVLFHAFFQHSALNFLKQAQELGLLNKVKFFGVYDSIEGIDPRPFEGSYFYTPMVHRLDEAPADIRPFQAKLYKTVGYREDGWDTRANRIGGSGHIYVGWEHVHWIKYGIEKSGWKSKKDNPDFIAALEGAKVKASDEFPQGDKFIRDVDHQTFMGVLIQQVKNGKYVTIGRIPPEKGVYPPEGDLRIKR